MCIDAAKTQHSKKLHGSTTTQTQPGVGEEEAVPGEKVTNDSDPLNLRRAVCSSASDE